MNETEKIEAGLAQLGSELGTRPELASRVIEAFRSRPKSHDESCATRRRSGWQVGGRWISTVAAAGLALAFVAWLVSPRTIYGRAAAALEKAGTVHVTGWARDVVRLWPLENPPAAVPATDARHPIETWYWTDSDEQPASFEKIGPVVRVRRGGTLREYQEDVKVLFISEGLRPKDFVARFSGVAEYLRALDEPGVARKSLGTRTEGGHSIKGWEVTRGDRSEEFWLDAKTDLPVRFTRWSGTGAAKVQVMEMLFAIDQPVPADVASYEPPETGNVRYGGKHANASLAWRQHVQEIGERLQGKPVDRRGELLPRENGRTFEPQWTLRTPDGKYWVMPIDDHFSSGMSLADFIRLRVATTTGERMHGTWRVPHELQQLNLGRHDLVYAEGTPWQDWLGTALDGFGLEFVDVVEKRTVWLARHDGRKLKPWQEVKPPVPYIVRNGREQKGLVAPGVGFKLVPVTMQELFQDFNATIDQTDFGARFPIIFDETGLPEPPPFDPQRYKSAQEFRDKLVIPQLGVASDSPYFAGAESIAMARDWYAREFGITFVEEVRPLTVHVVRRK